MSVFYSPSLKSQGGGYIFFKVKCYVMTYKMFSA